MKKVLTIIISLIVVFGLVSGCGSAPAPKDPTVKMDGQIQPSDAVVGQPVDLSLTVTNTSKQNIKDLVLIVNGSLMKNVVVTQTSPKAYFTDNQFEYGVLNAGEKKTFDITIVAKTAGNLDFGILPSDFNNDSFNFLKDAQDQDPSLNGSLTVTP